MRILVSFALLLALLTMIPVYGAVDETAFTGYAISAGPFMSSSTSVVLTGTGSEQYQTTYDEKTFAAGGGPGVTAYQQNVNLSADNTFDGIRKIDTGRAIIGEGITTFEAMGTSVIGQPGGALCCDAANVTPFCKDAYSIVDVFGANTLQMQTMMSGYVGGVPEDTEGNTMALTSQIGAIGTGGSITIQNGYNSITSETRDRFSQRITIGQDYAITGGFNYRTRASPDPQTFNPPADPVCPCPFP